MSHMRMVALGLLGLAAACGGRSAAPLVPLFATEMTTAFEVTLFVIDHKDAPFDPALAPFPSAQPASEARYSIYLDVLNLTNRTRGLLITQQPYARLRVMDDTGAIVWRLTNPSIPGAQILDVEPGQRLRFRRDLPALPPGDYRAHGSVFTPDFVPDIELSFSIR